MTHQNNAQNTIDRTDHQTELIILLWCLKTMSKLIKPSSGEITLEELEEHLTSECGLTIIEPAELTEDPLTEHEASLLHLLPEHEHPSWNAGTSELWSPESAQWYDQEQYDRVFVSPYADKRKASLHLAARCMRTNSRRVGEVFKSTGKWCVRVCDVEE